MDATSPTQPGPEIPADVRRAAADPDGPARAPKAGGKAKASKGKGRAPAVKGQPRSGKRRQSR